MKTTREKIMDYLNENSVASANELSRAFQVTPANIRHHLSVLLAENVIEITGLKLGTGRGRPVQLYRLREQVSRHNQDQLASSLLNVAYRSLPSEEQPEFLRQLARHLGGQAGSGVRNPTQRFYWAMHRLNEMQYQARWEARPEAPRIILEHCPYAAILPEHPELCQMDAYLLEALSGSNASLVARLEPNAQGLPQCIFHLK